MVMPWTPPSLGRPKSNGRPALAATSPSPVASMKNFPRTALRPVLVSTSTAARRSPMRTDSTAGKLQKVRTPASSSIRWKTTRMPVESNSCVSCRRG